MHWPVTEPAFFYTFGKYLVIVVFPLLWAYEQGWIFLFVFGRNLYIQHVSATLRWTSCNLMYVVCVIRTNNM